MSTHPHCIYICVFVFVGVHACVCVRLCACIRMCICKYVYVTFTVKLMIESTGEQHKCPVMGEDRKETARLLGKKGVSNTYYENLGRIKQDVLDAGTTTDCQTPAVLRQIKSEAFVAE